MPRCILVEEDTAQDFQSQSTDHCCQHKNDRVGQRFDKSITGKNKTIVRQAYESYISGNQVPVKKLMQIQKIIGYTVNHNAIITAGAIST